MRELGARFTQGIQEAFWLDTLSPSGIVACFADACRGSAGFRHHHDSGRSSGEEHEKAQGGGEKTKFRKLV